jgi:tetratricopeptide (TPR) repeat protein
MRLGIALIAAILSVGRIAHGQVAQTPSDTLGYEGLVTAAHDAVDRGEFAPTAEQRAALYKSAEQYARRAVAANPNDADGHFELSVAIGRNALTMGARDRVKYAAEVRDQALTALKLNPNHAGAEHVLGVWNAEVMRLSGFTRLVAKKLLGGQVFNEASWENALTHLERAVSLEPNRITHRLDLAAVYVDRDEKGKAIEQYEWIARAPVVDYNDAHYKDEAARRLKDLR